MTNAPVGTIANLAIAYASGYIYGSDRVRYTQRRVSVTSFDNHQMSGHCHLRRQHRTFVYERVSSCVDADTAKIVVDPYKYLSDLYRGSPRHSLDTLCNGRPELVKILFYVAKADGRLTAQERNVIHAACKVFTADPRVSRELVDAVLDSMQLPSITSFKRAVGAVANRLSPNTMRKLLIASQSIVKTQKTVSPGEQEALDYMVKRFNLPPR